jgi:sugar O-acyltransferase (sialic acid O-acetyltransferase NeuD family)
LKPGKRSKTQPPGLLIIGSSWQAFVLIDAIELAGSHRIAGFLDDTVPPGTKRHGYVVLGGINHAAKVCARAGIVDVAVAIGDNWWRRKISMQIAKERPALEFPVIKHPSAIVAASAKIGKGAVILAGSHVGPGSQVGDFCIVNTGSSLDHDAVMENYASIAPGVFTGGLVRIGECSAVGVGASISDRVSIGRHSVIGTGSVVVGDIPELVVAYGNPARVRRAREQGEAYISDQSPSRPDS